MISPRRYDSPRRPELYQDERHSHHPKAGPLIIRRYVTREISRPFLIIVGLFVAIFTSYTAAVILNEVASGLLPAVVITQLIGIKLLIALEVLLPVSLYFAVVLGLGRLHSDSEIVALAACGIGEGRLVAVVLRFALGIALLVACLSLVVRPWAQQQRYLVLAEAAATAKLDIEVLEAKQFFVGPGADYAVFADRVDLRSRAAEGVIVQIRRPEALQVIVAQRLHQPPRKEGDPLVFQFEEGSQYRLDTGGSSDILSKVHELRITLAPPQLVLAGQRSKEQDTLTLAGSARPKDLAEFQWRLATPWATLLLAVLAVPLSRSRPRQGRFGKTLAAVTAFAVLYLVMSFARNLVQEGYVGPIPGLWWPLVLVGAMLLVWLWRPWQRAG